LSPLQTHLRALTTAGLTPTLAGIRRGIEKESLRVTAAGKLAQTPHPQALGSALTHPQITTDFSEALLEFITAPSTSIDGLLTELDEIHRYSHRHIGEELLWPGSMPCLLGDEEDIPVAHYGTTNSGQMKTVYRLGLGHRYGRAMQTIAGVHYNFSLPDEFWQLLQQQEADQRPLQDYKTDKYFALIRNFRRTFWLLLYLFGAAPAVCSSFVQNRHHQLAPLPGLEHTLYSPYATSLRMGDLGYQSEAQQSLVVCYNNLDRYLQTLCGAIRQPLPDYQRIGLKDDQGQYRQLNTGLLQIENEFYSTVRPKRTAESGQTALQALQIGGVEYVEVRCVDLNPFEPLGVSRHQLHYLDAFLLYCLLEDSPIATLSEYRELQENQKRVVYDGRDPALTLLRAERSIPMQEWAAQIQAGVAECAAWLDQSCGGDAYRQAVAVQQQVLDGDLPTPAAQLIARMQDNNEDYHQAILALAQQHQQTFAARPVDSANEAQFAERARQSLRDQATMEAAETEGFDAYLAAYYAQYGDCINVLAAAATSAG